MEMEEMKPNLGELLRNNKVKVEPDSVDCEACPQRDPHKAVSSSWMETKHLNIKQEVVADCSSHSSDIKSSFSYDCDLSHADIKCFFLDDKYIKLKEKPCIEHTNGTKASDEYTPDGLADTEVDEKPNIEHTNVTKASDEYTPDDLADIEVDEKPNIEVLQASVETYKRSSCGQLREKQKTDVTGGPQDSVVEQKCGLQLFVHKFKQEVTPIHWPQHIDHKLKTEQPTDHKLKNEQYIDHKLKTQQTIDHKLKTEQPIDYKLKNEHYIDHKLITEQPIDHKLITEQPIDHKLITEQTIDHKLITEQTIDHKLITEQPIDHKLITEQPTDHKLITEQPSQHYKDDTQQTPVVCDLCNKNFQIKNKMFEKHVRSHLREKFYTCKKCKQRFHSHHQHQHHKELHRKVQGNKCEICDRKFTYQANLHKHMKLHTEQRSANLRSITCEICGKKFTYPSSLRQHMKLHREQKQFMCENCGHLFSRHDFKKHLKTHQEKTREAKIAKNVNIQCVACKKLCKKRNTFDKSTEIASEPKNNEIYYLVCTLCDKHFQYRSALQHHMKRHEDGQWYVCDVCGRGFVIKNDLKLHLVRHLTDNLHQCDVCGKHFSKAYYLKKHKLTHEDDNFLCRSCVRDPAMRHKRKEMRQSRVKPNRKRRRTKAEIQ